MTLTFPLKKFDVPEFIKTYCSNYKEFIDKYNKHKNKDKFIIKLWLDYIKLLKKKKYLAKNIRILLKVLGENNFGKYVTETIANNFVDKLSKKYKVVYTNNYKRGKKIGKGYQNTYLVKKNNKTYVGKYVKLDNLWGYSKIENKIRALTKLSKLSFVPNFVELVKTKNNLIIITEYIKGVPLNKYIKDHELTESDYEKILKMVNKIHKLKITHGHLYNDKIIVNNGKFYIIGFSLSDSGYIKNKESLKGLFIQDYKHQYNYNKKEFLLEIVLYQMIQNKDIILK
jgi:tRNA A-37 threonylcarbamoyl transferase component Bud32